MIPPTDLSPLIRPRRGLAALLIVAAALVAAPRATPADTRDPLDAVVQVSARVPPDARTAASLGSEREGSGVVIDDDGLIVTIGYLVLEAAEIEIRGAHGAMPADVVAYDHETGFGLLRTVRALDVEPIAFGDSDALARMQPLLAVSRVGDLEPAGVYLVDRREFAGYWEYLLDEALFTTPPHRQFGGAALLDRDGRLVGIGSLFVNDAATRGRHSVPGNMFVPINALKPVLGDLLADGRRSDPPRPWLGLSAEEHRGRVFVTRVTPGGPAADAGLREDDLIVGVGGVPVDGLADFYRKVWAQGGAGIEVPLDVLDGVEVGREVVRSADRYRFLRLRPTY